MSGGEDGALRVWNSSSGELFEVVEDAHDDYVFAVVFSKDGNYLASAGADMVIKIWEVH